MKTTPQILFALTTLLLAQPGIAQPTSGSSAKSTQSAKDGGKSTLRRSSRMEFDGRLVKGERAAGAVYLFQRAPRRLPPLLRLKRDQLDRIVLPVLKRPADPVVPVASAKKASPAGGLKGAPSNAGKGASKAERKRRKASKKIKKKRRNKKKRKSRKNRR